MPQLVLLRHSQSTWNQEDRFTDGNSLRALVKHLDAISDAAIVGLEIPTGVPIVYELDANLRPIAHYSLDSSR